MKRIVFGLGALALGALAIGTTPVMAQGVSVDVPGFHAGIGNRYDDDWRWRHRRGFQSYNYYGGGCRDVTITRRNAYGDLVTKQIRRCD